ncbi:hypothetical protein [Sellimonas intestinalis]
MTCSPSLFSGSTSLRCRLDNFPFLSGVKNGIK